MAQKAINRREALGLLGGTALSSALPATAAAPTPRRHKPTDKPNVLFITTEGIPLSALSCYGSRLIHTPNIDRLAHEGMRFENSFCTNALCAPARATLLTGKYDHLNGMTTNPAETLSGAPTETTFSATQQTLPRILQQHGYQTGIVGKWHLPVNPGDVGFDYFLYKNNAGGPYYEAEHYLRNKTLGSPETEEVSIPGYITDNVVDAAIKGMESFTKPFFLMLQFFNAHRPFDPKHEYEHLYDGVRFPEPGTFYDDYSFRSSAAAAARMRVSEMPDFDPPADLTERQRKQWNYHQLMAHFLGTLRAQDENMGRLLTYLDQSGLAENTIIIFTGDHGFFLGDHGWFDKRFMYEQSIRIPWLIRWPGHVPAGKVSKDWVVNIDDAPTVLDLLGIPIPADMQGRSLVPVLQGRTPADWQKSFYYHYYEFAPPHWVLPHYGIRTERYKLIFFYTVNQWELFDLEKDPDEMESLMEWNGFRVHPGYEAIAADLVQQLTVIRAKYNDTTGAPVRFWPTNSYD